MLFRSHDELAQSILLCPDAAYIAKVQAAIDRFNRELLRRLESEGIELAIPLYEVQGFGPMGAEAPETLRGGSSPPLL